jgi:nudix-type nucleoside diphosphatase (YffH/AdpP family)
MPHPHRVDILRPPERVFKGFFNIDQYSVSFERYDGTMSKPCQRLNFERGDAVGVLLFNLDTRSVVLVEQFKLPTLIGRRRDGVTLNGWIVEVMAGMIKDGETAEATAIRETEEETGYLIDNPQPICKFLSSPGGTSERIFLYFATVTDAKRSPPEDPKKDARGVDDEDIKVLQVSINDLFDRLEKGQIDDPKLAIAAYWLKDNMAGIEALSPNTVEYEIVGKPGLIVGYKTGDIKDVHGVDVWVNGENSDMMMDRFIGGSVSARIRAMGANKDGNVVVEDTIQEALRGLMGERAKVDIGRVLITESGMLRQDNDVQRIFHVAVLEGSLAPAIKPRVADLRPCVEAVLKELERENKKLLRLFSENYLESVLIPMIGAGEGALPIQTVADEIIPAAVDHFKSVPNSTVKKVYFLAFRLREKNACDKVLERYCEQGVLRRLSQAAAPDADGLAAVGGQAR